MGGFRSDPGWPRVAALEILRDGPPLPAELLALLAFCSKYYHHPIGEVVLNSLPSRLRRAHGSRDGQIERKRPVRADARRPLRGCEGAPSRELWRDPD